MDEQFIKEQLEKLQSAKTWQEQRAAIVALDLNDIRDAIVVQPLVDAAQKGMSSIVRRYAVRLLGEIGDPKAVKPLILVLLKSPAPSVRWGAAKALGKIGDVRAVEFLIAVIEDAEEEMTVRNEAAEALGKIPAEEAINSLVVALDTNLGEKASEVLERVGKPAVMPLVVAINDCNEAIIWKAVDILGTIGDKRASQPLIALLLDEGKDEWDRGYHVAVALGKIGDSKAVEPLIRLASRHTEDQLTCNTVWALGEIGDYRAVDPLIRILEDERTVDCSSLRLQTCWALRKLKDMKAVEPLIKILENPRKTTYGLETAGAVALVELDDDRIELPLLKFFKTELEARLDSENREEKQHDEVLEVVVKLIARLIDKGRSD